MTDEKADEVGVRYIVRDVAATLEFYRDAFGFDVGLVAGDAFAEVRRGHLRLLLSGPGSSGARVVVDGRHPEPGGWNRIQHVVADLARTVEELAAKGIVPASEPVSGPGGSQVIYRDPDGNLVEVFEPAAR
jgi:catechol 2,3-dioxygenase-like lactoylglutathione lyase family enzyme